MEEEKDVKAPTPRQEVGGTESRPESVGKEKPKPVSEDEVLEKKPSGGGGKACLWIGLILVAVLIIGYFGLAWLLRTLDKTQPEPSAKTSTSSASSSTDSANKGVAQFTGTWETECLVPDANSPWAEQHKFVFKSDGTATHTRSSGDSCAVIKEDTPQNYKVTVPAEGKIDFIGTGSGGSIYDMYKLSGDSLWFGHGFCNCTTTGGSGTSDSSRINRLNTFLEYKKK